MGDAKNYIEIAIFLVGWIAVVAALKQGQRDLNQKVDDGHKDMKAQVGQIDGKVENLARMVTTIDREQGIQASKLITLDEKQKQTARDSEICHDELKGDVSRLSRLSNKLDRWRAAADQQLKRLDGSWQPPVNGSD